MKRKARPKDAPRYERIHPCDDTGPRGNVIYLHNDKLVYASDNTDTGLHPVDMALLIEQGHWRRIEDTKP